MSKKTLTYKSAKEELDQLVEKLKNPECDVDELTALTSRAVELLQFCNDKLTRVDEDLTKVLEKIK